MTAIWVVDDRGQVVFEGSVATDPDMIAAALAGHAPDLVGLEAGPMSHGPVATWSRDGPHGDTACACGAQGLARKTDRRDTCGIAHLLRRGWFRPVQVKRASARERRVLLVPVAAWSGGCAISTAACMVCCAASVSDGPTAPLAMLGGNDNSLVLKRAGYDHLLND